MTSLEKKIVFSEESAKSFLSEIEDLRGTFRSLQQEYGPVSAQIQELQKNVGILAARTAGKREGHEN
jgi:phage shock protein A